MPDNRTTEGEFEGDGAEIGEVLVCQAGCGILYKLALEDEDEMRWDIFLGRQEAETLYAILGKMLEKPEPMKALPPATTAPTVHDWVNQSNWQIPPHSAGPWFGIQPWWNLPWQR